MADFSVQPLIDAWRRATEELKVRVAERAALAADRTAQRAEAAYPMRTGALRASVRRQSRPGTSERIEAAVVRVQAPHVHFVERGTGQRFDSTRGGARRGQVRGIGPALVDIAMDEREAYLRDAQRMLDEPRNLV